MGVIGAGLIAQIMHLPHLRDLDDRFEVAALCDLSEEVLRQVGDRFAVARRYTRWQDLVVDPGLDAVLVSTPGSHAEPAIAASQAGLHVFVEKPMCFSVEEGRAMLAAARAAGRRLMVGYMKRYDPAFLRLREELGSLPDPLRLVRVTTLEAPFEPYVAHHRIDRGRDVPRHILEQLQEQERSGLARALAPGVPSEAAHAYRWVLLDSLVHELNLLRGALGEPERVDHVDIRPNELTVMLTFPGDVPCLVAWVDLPGLARYRQELAFYAPSRRLTLAFPSPYLRHMPTELTIEAGDAASSRSWQTDETVSYAEAFKQELVAFSDAVADGRDPPTAGDDGLRDVALCQAIVESYARGAPVQAPTVVHSGAAA